MPTRVAVDDDEQQIQDLIKEMRRLRSRLATTAVKGTHDEFTAAATPATTYTLTYIPLTGTCLMALNGHVQREGTDYTCDYTTGIVTVSATQAAGDKITFRYLVTDWLIARSQIAESDWTVINGIWDVSGVTPFATNSGGGEGLIVQPASSPDVTVQVTITALAGISGIGLTFRLSDINNFWFFALTNTASFLYKVVANTYTQVGTWAGASAGDILTAVTSGTSITVKRNGTTVGSTTDSFNQTATEHGIYSEATGVHFSNFSITR